MSVAAEHVDPHHPNLRPEDWPAERLYGVVTAGKVGMWVFLLSDALMFAGFLLGYGILRGGADVWHCTEAWAAQTGCAVTPELGINFTAGLTFLLICSSVTMVMAYANVVERNRKGALLWLGLTVLGGSLFLVGQYAEYFGLFGIGGLTKHGLVFGESHYANTFYLITSFHGAHVLTGTIYNAVIWIQTARGKFDDGNYNQIELAGLFWHFVDLIWILVFTLVYLVPNPPPVG